jgi:hypothetical protein
MRIRILNTENRTAPDVWTRTPIEEEPDKPTENVQTSDNQVHLHVVPVVKPKNISLYIKRNLRYGFQHVPVIKNRLTKLT